MVITLMVLSALLCFLRPGWELSPTLWAIAGALLFYISDTILAMDRFVNPIPHARLLTMTTYHLGQLGILVSAAMTFLR
jgi:alkenylglycerophosphocholine/alkenylglycerophosphoethanolamine hydrolase